MGDFKGHVAPAIFMMIAGMLYYLRALDLTMTQKIRNNKVGHLGPPIIVAVMGFCLFTGESIDMTVNKAFSSMSHHLHLRLDFLLFLAGFIHMLFMSNRLRGPVWPLTAPVILAFMGFILFTHTQKNLVETYGHYIAAIGILSLCVSLIAETFVGLHMRKEGSPHPSQDTQTLIPGIHWIFTNPALYESVFPMLSGAIICLNGCYWFIMGYNFYIGDVEARFPSANEPMFAVSAVMGMVFNVFLITLSGLVLLTLVLQFVDNRYFSSWASSTLERPFIPLTTIHTDDSEEKNID